MLRAALRLFVPVALGAVALGACGLDERVSPLDAGDGEAEVACPYVCIDCDSGVEVPPSCGGDAICPAGYSTQCQPDDADAGPG